MTFNTTENVTTVMELAQYNYAVTDGGYGIFILFVAFLVAFGSIKTTTGDSKGAFTASSFVCFILSVVLTIAGLATTTEVFLCFAAFLVGAIITGLAMALFLNNGGGALDNAKKLRKKARDKTDLRTMEAYHAAVQGDIVGDPMKDTAGPSINVVLTLILTIALQFAVLFVMIHY